LQPAIAGYWGPVAGVALSSVIFGAMHSMTLRYFVLATLMSVYLGWTQLFTQNLLVPIIIHTLFDVIGFLEHSQYVQEFLGKIGIRS
jgi:uncharacterized protein